MGNVVNQGLVIFWDVLLKFLCSHLRARGSPISILRLLVGLLIITEMIKHNKQLHNGYVSYIIHVGCMTNIKGIPLKYFV